MRILLWHGYLLGGSGSNVYTRAIAREWTRAGHEVVVFCQERHPEGFDLGGAEVVRPGLPYKLLPVFVLDEYEGLEAQLLGDFTLTQRELYVEANAAVLREHMPADLVFLNHVLLGAPVGAASGARFAVKAHGSELEYAMRPSPELALWAKETLPAAEAVFVGSAHIRTVLEELVGAVGPVYEVPPGVDVDEFRPRPREEALDALLKETVADPPNPGNRDERLPDESNAERFEAFFADEGPVVVFVGKLLYNKGVHVLLRHLVHLLPLADVAVVPSIFPEAFGMVAAEAAAAGVPPLVALHSGLAEVAEGIRPEYGEAHRDLVSFTTGDAFDLADKLRALLALPQATREELGLAARRAAVQLWSWRSVAARLLQPFD